MASLISRLVSITAIISAVTAGEQKPCNAKQFDYDSVVCVCTEDYCDSINPKLPSSGQYLKVSSDKKGDRFAYDYGNKIPSAENISVEHYESLLFKKSAILEVRRNETGQTIIGFGSSINDGVGINLKNITEKLKDILMESCFGAEGLKYNMLRTTIGHCDYSLSPYYYTNITDDVNMTSWSLRYEDYNYRLPFIKQAKQIAENDILITASIWGIPEWMREESPTGRINMIRADRFDAHSLYIIKYLEAFKEEGIEFWGVSYANEPILTALANFDENDSNFNTVWSWNKLATYVTDYFGPALQKYGFTDTKILFFDELRYALFSHYINEFFSVEGIEKYVDTISLHSYLNINVSTLIVDNFHTQYPNVTIITTELGSGQWEGVRFGAWSRAEFYATNYLEELNHHHSAWIDWSMALNDKNGPRIIWPATDTPIIVMAEENCFYKQPSWYAIGHFSKWMPGGSTYVKLESLFSTDLEYGAVIRPDGLITAVVQNKANYNINLTIKDDQGDFNVDVAPNSINTLIF